MSENLTQDLDIKHVLVKFVLWLLLQEQKENCAIVASDLIQTTDNEPDYFKKVITRDELWVYGYNLETKAQSSQWRSPDSLCPKVRQGRSKIMTTLTVFFDWKGVIHHKYALQAKQLIRSTTSMFFVG